MPRLMQALARQFSLMVSLPRNRPELARSAVEAGANSIKVHLNCEHFASGTRFGTWAEEKSALLEILQAAGDIPVGLVSGEEHQPSPEDWVEIAEAGFDFWDLFARYAPPRYLELDMGKMVAVDSSWTPELMKDLAHLGVQVIESSIIPRSDYGTPLNLVDLSRYAQLVRATPMPIMVPTQKALLPDEVIYLRRAGAAGVTIGAIVTGLEPDSLRSATARFAEAVAAVPELSTSGQRF